MLPQINAEMLGVFTTGASEDWDQDAAEGNAKWSGDEGVYVIEKIRTNFSQSEGSLVKTRDIQIVISATLTGIDGQPLIIETGDYVTYKFRDQLHTRKVMEFSGAASPVGFNIPEYLRLHMNPEAVETAMEQQ